MKLTREFWIPKSFAAKIESKVSGAVVYLIDSAKHGRPVAMGFYRNSVKPAFNFSFRSVERRAEHCAEFLKAADAQVARRAAARATRKAFEHTLKVGDVLGTCWGYDQTNREFFEVTKLVSRTMVEVRELTQESVDTGYMSGNCVPVPGSYHGEAKRFRVLPGNQLNIHRADFGRASPLEYREIAGVRVYDSASWSSYA